MSSRFSRRRNSSLILFMEAVVVIIAGFETVGSSIEQNGMVAAND